MSNPWATVDCYFCGAKGCYCKGKIREHELDCVPCDICEGSGQIVAESLRRMADHYKADEQFKRAWKSALIILLCLSSLIS